MSRGGADGAAARASEGCVSAAFLASGRCGTAVAPEATMLRITRLPGDGGIPTVVVEGRLTEGTMNELASALDGTAGVRIDVSGLRFADAAGVGAIRSATRSGAELVGCSGFLTELLRRDATDDGDLVARLQAGDDAAFET